MIWFLIQLEGQLRQAPLPCPQAAKYRKLSSVTRGVFDYVLMIYLTYQIASDMPHKPHTFGFTLVELMVSTALSLFILSGVIYIYTHVISSVNKELKVIRLNNELQAIINTISKELRRASYWSQAHLQIGKANGFMPINITESQTGEMNACILYSYDRDKDNADGKPNTDNQFGYQLSSGIIRTKSRDASCNGVTCSNCTTGNWWQVTDGNTVKITELKFTVNNLMLPIDLDYSMSIRQLDIKLSGELRNDSNISQHIHKTINIPNHAMLKL